MAITVARYTFGSWLRKGIAAKINEIDNLGMGTSPVKERATVPIDVAVNAQPIHKDFSLIGPGDIIGINPKLVVRTEPKNWVTDYEPNYFPAIEFYDEDFGWRYTPARPNGQKLRPWLALIVLKESPIEDEQEFTKEDKRLPLPVVKVKSAASLPPVSETWAWCHVHTNAGYESDSEFEEFLETLHNLDHPNADKIICRLMCPRRLEQNTAYRAFVVPAFETGRKAGLNLATTDVDSQLPSWSSSSNGVELPIYYEWYFRTGENEDFESLVKILEPRSIDEKVGIRDMDGSKPGFGMTEGTNIGSILPIDLNQEVIGLEGALKSPDTTSRPETIDTAKPFFVQLKDILNFPAELQKISNTSIDPVVSPPIYGENHARQHEIDIAHSGWLHHLNKDPRLRVPSGFGTNVIQKNQEDYMAKAWGQVRKILDANKKIIFMAFSMNFALTMKENFLDKFSSEKMITYLGPVLKKVMGSPTTLYTQLRKSNIPMTVVSASFRRIIRPRGVFFKKLKSADSNFSHAQMIQDLNNKIISPAPPKITPFGIGTVEGYIEDHPVKSWSNFLKWLIKHRFWLLILFLIIFLLIGLIANLWYVALAGFILSVVAYIYLGRLKKKVTATEAFDDPSSLTEVIKETGPRSDFKLIETNPVVPPRSISGTTTTTTTESTSGSGDAVNFTSVTFHTSAGAGKDSIEAQNFRNASLKLNMRLSLIAPEENREEFDLNNAKLKLTSAMNPKIAFPKQLASLVYFSFNPQWLLAAEHLVPAMAYPDFEDPMYEKLRDISSELLIPNLKLIPPNTISLLVTNPQFIESYMVGLNHEFGKELLWRKFPTDRRGSYFRQFWDVKGIITNESGLTKEELTEKYKDITPLDTWTSNSKLGLHNNRNIHDAKQVVLLIRGDLLKKYPQTIIYAQKGKIYKEDGIPDPSHEPVIEEVKTAQQMAKEIKFPIFKANIDPDIKFFGFDLTIEEAKGDDNPQTETDDWGYYFVIQEIPGDPRFGMDITYSPDDDLDTPITWDDMSWEKYDNGEPFVKTSVLPHSGFFPAGPDESRSQWGEDASKMAYILYQKPVMIAVHAKEMLKDL